MTIRLQIEIRKPLPSLFLTMFLQNLEGTRVLFSDIRDTNLPVDERLGVGLHTFDIAIPPRLLAPTTYLLSLTVLSGFVASSMNGRRVANSRFAIFHTVSTPPSALAFWAYCSSGTLSTGSQPTLPRRRIESGARYYSGHGSTLT